jgi:hypothetical protein
VLPLRTGFQVRVRIRIPMSLAGHYGNRVNLLDGAAVVIFTKSSSRPPAQLTVKETTTSGSSRRGLKRAVIQTKPERVRIALASPIRQERL